MNMLVESEHVDNIKLQLMCLFVLYPATVKFTEQMTKQKNIKMIYLLWRQFFKVTEHF